MERSFFEVPEKDCNGVLHLGKEKKPENLPKVGCFGILDAKAKDWMLQMGKTESKA